jgi:MYXO-CTERM domain-containing protein
MTADDGDTIYTDWGDTQPPAKLRAVVEGIDHDMALTYGTGANGVYSVVVAGLGEEDCGAWYVEWTTEGGESGTFPATGSWLAGEGCEADDEGAAWIAHQNPSGGLFGDLEGDALNDKMLDDLSLTCGCASGPAPGAWLGLLVPLAALLVVHRRG